MTETERKFYQNSSKSWLSVVRSMETRGKKQLLPSNANLYHYAGNNPVCYVDPDGRNVTNNTKDYIIARLEDPITLKDGTKIDTVVLAPGETFIGNVDGTRDKDGNYTKISCQDGDNINYTVKEGNIIEFDDDKNDLKKNINNYSPLRIINGKKLTSGSYPNDSEGGKFLSGKWDGRFKEDLGDGFNNYEDAYKSDVQKKLRDEKVISNNGSNK